MARRSKMTKEQKALGREQRAQERGFQQAAAVFGGPASPFTGFGGFANLQPAKKTKKARQTVAKKTGKKGRGKQIVKGGQNLGQALAMAGMAAAAQKARKESFHAVSKEYGIQVMSSVGEFLGALATRSVQVAVEASVTTLDDKAAPVVLGLAATGLRFYSDRYLSQKHFGLAKVLSSTASSSMGVTWSGKLTEWGVKAKQAMMSKGS